MKLDKLFQLFLGDTDNVLVIPTFVLFQEGMGMLQIFHNVVIGKGLQAFQARTNLQRSIVKGTCKENAIRHPLPLITHPFDRNEIVTVGSGSHDDGKTGMTRTQGVSMKLQSSS
ncbi:hypothetical protein TNIN_277641 [Trichonephila inaurata madagascariensis]|uniref:Uncharacterized protein n=1 Tax=Trichonephila inaurata madagascariensis TaxID=2747483 RepID=A0A8X7CBS1_9ARAC|nr:hypothetical protein TNIN_277641 [Trichonephila inaurata madagascariensis]